MFINWSKNRNMEIDIDLNNYKCSNKITAKQDLKIVSTSHQSGSPNQISSCSSYCCGGYGTRKNSEGKEESYCKRWASQESGSCVQGQEGDVCDVQLYTTCL